MISVKIDLPFLSLNPSPRQRTPVRSGGTAGDRDQEKPGTQASAKAYAAALEALAQPRQRMGVRTPTTATKGTLGWLAASIMLPMNPPAWTRNRRSRAGASSIAAW